VQRRLASSQGCLSWSCNQQPFRVCHPQGYLPAADLPDVSNRGDTHCAIPRLAQQRAKWAIVREIRLAEEHVAE